MCSMADSLVRGPFLTSPLECVRRFVRHIFQQRVFVARNLAVSMHKFARFEAGNTEYRDNGRACQITKNFKICSLEVMRGYPIFPHLPPPKSLPAIYTSVSLTSTNRSMSTTRCLQRSQETEDGHSHTKTLGLVALVGGRRRSRSGGGLAARGGSGGGAS